MFSYNGLTISTSKLHYQNLSYITLFSSSLHHWSSNPIIISHHIYTKSNPNSLRSPSSHFLISKRDFNLIIHNFFFFPIVKSIYATTRVAVCTLVLVDFLLDSFDFLDTFHLFSLASSISICSCLHSWLQNGLFPLKKQRYIHISNSKIRFAHSTTKN